MRFDGIYARKVRLVATKKNLPWFFVLILVIGSVFLAFNTNVTAQAYSKISAIKSTNKATVAPKATAPITYPEKTVFTGNKTDNSSVQSQSSNDVSGWDWVGAPVKNDDGTYPLVQAEYNYKSAEDMHDQYLNVARVAVALPSNIAETHPKITATMTFIPYDGVDEQNAFKQLQTGPATQNNALRIRTDFPLTEGYRDWNNNIDSSTKIINDGTMSIFATTYGLNFNVYQTFQLDTVATLSMLTLQDSSSAVGSYLFYTPVVLNDQGYYGSSFYTGACVPDQSGNFPNCKRGTGLKSIGATYLGAVLTGDFPSSCRSGAVRGYDPYTTGIFNSSLDAKYLNVASGQTPKSFTFGIWSQETQNNNGVPFNGDFYAALGAGGESISFQQLVNNPTAGFFFSTGGSNTGDISVESKTYPPTGFNEITVTAPSELAKLAQDPYIQAHGFASLALFEVNPSHTQYQKRTIGYCMQMSSDDVAAGFSEDFTNSSINFDPSSINGQLYNPWMNLMSVKFGY